MKNIKNIEKKREQVHFAVVVLSLLYLFLVSICCQLLSFFVNEQRIIWETIYFIFILLDFFRFVCVSVYLCEVEMLKSFRIRIH